MLHAALDPSPAVDDLVASGLDGDAAVRRIVEIVGEDGARVVLLRMAAGLSVDDVAARARVGAAATPPADRRV